MVRSFIRFILSWMLLGDMCFKEITINFFFALQTSNFMAILSFCSFTLHCFSVLSFFRRHTAASNDRTLVFRQKWRKTGKRRETNYENAFSVCKIEQRYSRFSIKPKEGHRFFLNFTSVLLCHILVCPSFPLVFPNFPGF